jgi:hypothetical protein
MRDSWLCSELFSIIHQRAERGVRVRVTAGWPDRWPEALTFWTVAASNVWNEPVLCTLFRRGLHEEVQHSVAEPEPMEVGVTLLPEAEQRRRRQLRLCLYCG